MTDLEELWDSYPEGEPPVADLLRKARSEARARRRRYVVRPLVVGATVAAVAVGYVAGNRVGDPDADRGSGTSAADGGADSSASLVRNVAFQADLQPADSCAQLLASYQKRALAEVGAYGWNYGGWGLYDKALSATAVAGTSPVAGVRQPSASLDGVANSATGTNVQETGVDEPDRVKTNGTLLARAGQHAVKVYDVSGAEVRLDAKLDLPHVGDPQLLLSGTTLAVLGYDTARGMKDGTGTRVVTVSLADAKHPVITSQVRYSGALDTARLQGTDVHLVLADGRPALKFVYPHDRRHGDLTRRAARLRNRQIVRNTTLDDWLPRVDDGSGSRPLLDCDQVAMPPDGVSLGTESVVGFDIAAPTEVRAIGIAGTTSITYESADRLYLTAGQGGFVCGGGVACPLVATVRGAPTDADKTTIFQFDLAGTSATHVATGTVDGSIADRWSMDEAAGVLRVAVTESGTPGKKGAKQQSSVITLKPDGQKLVEIGRLDGLGVGETLTAARWFDDLAILSTAKQTDPLFTVDLTDPARPVLLGALHIPGFSSYFHPIGNGQLLGIGQEVAFEHRNEREKAQVGLFDITDLADVKQDAVSSLAQWTWPDAGDDPHAFTWLPDRSVALTSFRTRDGSTLLGEYHVDGATLTQKLVPLDGRRYSMTVRTLELPSGKVVLMAGGKVSFLDL